VEAMWFALMHPNQAPVMLPLPVFENDLFVLEFIYPFIIIYS